MDQEVWGSGARFAKEERKGRGFGSGRAIVPMLKKE
jgi:hypothetical protein